MRHQGHEAFHPSCEKEERRIEGETGLGGQPLRKTTQHSPVIMVRDPRGIHLHDEALTAEIEVERDRGEESKIIGYLAHARDLVEHIDLFGHGADEFYQSVGHGQFDHAIEHLGTFTEYKYLLLLLFALSVLPRIGGERRLQGPLLSR